MSMLESNKIIIVGGGSAGWMTAATLIKVFPEKEITVIESPNKKTIGVGESTLGQINEWLSLLEIKDEDFMPFTKASYKLSIKFENFYKLKDKGFHYPFGSVYENAYVGPKESWFFKKKFKPETPIADYADSISPNMWLVNNNVLFKNEKDEIPLFNFNKHVAYHFDAHLFAEWLQKYYCIPKGVKHILEDIETVEKNEEGIVSLNKKYFADLYIDCTGFTSLLLGQTLKEPFNDYSNLLPNNKAWATSLEYSRKEKELKPYTTCTAIGNGWVWNIPSWDKIGTGYVYSDKFVSDEEALEEFKKYLGKDNLKFKNIEMKVGIHERIFVKNVCAIGLSAGFIEPLESNGLLSVHEFLMRLIKILKRNNLSQWDRDTFNVSCKSFFDNFAEFVAYHYALSHRRDTEYWRSINDTSFYKKSIIDSQLKENIPAFIERNKWFISDGGSHYISTGMNSFAVDVVDKKITKEMEAWVLARQYDIKKYNEICSKKNSLYKFLKEGIHRS